MQFKFTPLSLLALFVFVCSFSSGQTNNSAEIKKLETKLMLEDLGIYEQANLHLKIGKLERGNNTQKSFQHFFISIKKFESIENYQGASKANHQICEMYMDAQRWDKAIKYGLKSLELIDGKVINPILLNDLATSYVRLELYDEAFKYVNIYKTSCSKNDRECKSKAYQLLALVYGESGNQDSSIVYSQRALENIDASNLIARANVLNNLGVTFKEQKRFDEAIAAFYQSKELYIGPNDHPNKAIALLNIALVETIQEKYDSAYVHSQAALAGILKSSRHQFLIDCYLNLAEVSEQLGRPEQSLGYYKSYFKALGNLKTEDMKSNMAALKLKDELELAEADAKDELIRTQIKQENTNLIWTVSTLILLLFIAIGALLLKRIKSKHKIDRLLLENSQLNQDVLKKRIDFTGGELSQLSAYIASRNEFLDDLKRRIKESKGLSSENRNDLLGTINQFLNSDRESHSSDTLIEETNQLLFFNLDKRGVELSPKEKKLLFYLISDLSSKQIGDLTNVNSASVDTARYRIRAKLNVPKGDTIQNFLRNVMKS
jgi:tetratricopeptide (TPR) repeat protein/DNA-binding CsgD family transcriptional regulator